MDISISNKLYSSSSNSIQSGYTTTAVVFDGTNDSMARGADLTGNADSKSGLISFWIKFNGGDGSSQIVYGDNDISGTVFKNASDNIEIQFENASSVDILNVKSTETVTVSSGWTHVLIAYDLATTTTQIIVDGVSGRTETTVTDDTIDYTRTNHIIGEFLTFFRLNADIADLYINFGETLDISVEANERKFRDANGKPVDLGSDGSLPTGTAPIMFFRADSGTPSSFATNRGTGGNMTITGTLTQASTSPSD